MVRPVAGRRSGVGALAFESGRRLRSAAHWHLHPGPARRPVGVGDGAGRAARSGAAYTAPRPERRPAVDRAPARAARRPLPRRLLHPALRVVSPHPRGVSQPLLPSRQPRANGGPARPRAGPAASRYHPLAVPRPQHHLGTGRVRPGCRRLHPDDELPKRPPHAPAHLLLRLRQDRAPGRAAGLPRRPVRLLLPVGGDAPRGRAGTPPLVVVAVVVSIVVVVPVVRVVAPIPVLLLLFPGPVAEFSVVPVRHSLPLDIEGDLVTVPAVIVAVVRVIIGLVGGAAGD